MHNIIATTITDAAVQYDGNGVAQKKKTACISNCKTWDRTSVKNGNSSKFHSVPFLPQKHEHHKDFKFVLLIVL